MKQRWLIQAGGKRRSRDVSTTSPGLPRGNAETSPKNARRKVRFAYDPTCRTRVGWRPPLFSTYETWPMCEILAREMVAGPWREDDLFASTRPLLTRLWRGLKPFIGRMLAALGTDARPMQSKVLEFIWADDKFRTVCWFDREPPEGHKSQPLGVICDFSAVRAPVMWPARGGPESWQVAAIVTPEALADQLGIKRNELEWLADCQGREIRKIDPPAPRYRLKFIPKRNGQSRLIEAPNPRLKAIQRLLLRNVVAHIPPHPAAHGFRQGRSVLTYVSSHVGKRVVLKLDLRDFFSTITGVRVRALFMRAGYPEAVARLMTGLTTNRVAGRVLKGRAGISRHLVEQPHLPQGAATSPALANACAYRLDMRLSALAQAAGGTYTRYADDLAFSGDRGFERCVDRLIVHIMAVAIEEGFEIQPRKTKVMRQSIRQVVAGAVINVRPNVVRAEFDILKATLYNCVKHGPDSQNRGKSADFRAHLLGRVSYVASLNAERGKHLLAMFERIDWPKEFGKDRTG